MPFQPGNQLAKLKKPRKKEYRDMLASHAGDAINALVEIMQTGKNDKDRIAAAIALLDRCYGKPGQALRIDHNAPIDTGAIHAALADQARGIMIATDDDGVQQLMITPSQQLPNKGVIEVETLQSDQSEDQ